MRAVLDTNVLVSGAIKHQGKPAQILRQTPDKFVLVCSEFILQELADVLGRAHIQRKYPDKVTLAQRELFVSAIRILSAMVDPQTELGKSTRDPKDDPVLACAVDGQADYLVTGDPHLLELEEFRRIKIVTPGEFLQVLDRRPGQG
jgi:putative PIN family toxin of toxin-antitoxin system